MPVLKLSNGTYLAIINFFHFVAAGLVLPVLSKQIARYGANHIVLGSLQSMIFIAQTTSKDFLELFQRAHISLLKISLYLTFLYFGMFLFASVWWVICLIRLGYALTTQVQSYSKDYIIKTEPRSRRTIICNMIDIMRVIGLTLGNILGGFIFDRTRNVVYHSLLGCLMTLLAMFFFHLMPNDDRVTLTSGSQMFTYQKTTIERLQNLRDVKFRNLQNRVILKMSYLLTFVTFFSRYIFILCQNYKVDSTIVGWVRGYQYILRFIFSFIAPFIIEQTSNRKTLFAHSMLISGASMVALFYAPSYHCYLVCFIPLMFTYTLVNSLMNEDVLNFKSNVSVYLAIQTLGTIVNIVSPIFYGISRQYTGAGMTKFFVLAPATIWAYLLHKEIFSQRVAVRYSIYNAQSLMQIFSASICDDAFRYDGEDSVAESLEEEAKVEEVVYLRKPSVNTRKMSVKQEVSFQVEPMTYQYEDAHGSHDPHDTESSRDTLSSQDAPSSHDSQNSQDTQDKKK